MTDYSSGYKPIEYEEIHFMRQKEADNMYESDLRKNRCPFSRTVSSCGDWCKIYIKEENKCLLQSFDSRFQNLDTKLQNIDSKIGQILDSQEPIADLINSIKSIEDWTSIMANLMKENSSR